MSRPDVQRVADILDAADELARIVADGRAAFDRETMRARAVERLLEIIGEATTALSDEFKSGCPEIAWRDISALRILLAHRYHRVDPAQVWEIAASSVPDLARRLRAR